jgi:hypothetical protein
MGQQRTVLGSTSLETALARLEAGGVGCQVLMVDGQLVHPSAKAPEKWAEVRLRTPAGMVTLRRQADQVSILVFGNATSDLVRMRDRIAEAFAPH